MSMQTGGGGDSGGMSRDESGARSKLLECLSKVDQQVGQ